MSQRKSHLARNPFKRSLQKPLRSIFSLTKSPKRQSERRDARHLKNIRNAIITTLQCEGYPQDVAEAFAERRISALKKGEPRKAVDTTSRSSRDPLASPASDTKGVNIPRTDKHKPALMRTHPRTLLTAMPGVADLTAVDASTRKAEAQTTDHPSHKA